MSQTTSTKTVEPKIIISGTGRSGTTFLVKVFTYLGFDTGFSIEQIEGAQPHNGGPGLEQPNRLTSVPQVIKSPAWAFHLDKIRLGWDMVPIRGIIVTVRDPVEVALSRYRRRDIGSQYGAPMTPESETLSAEIEMAKIMLGNFWEAFQDPSFKVPMQFVEFNKFTKDAEYLYTELEPIFEDRAITPETFKEAYNKATALWKKGEF